MKTWQSYSDNADMYFRLYEELKFEDVHASFFKFLPSKEGTCLDVGSGSGRDAAAMAKLGYSVTAVEPSEVLLKLAQINHSSLGIQWINDCLPDLNEIKSLKMTYDFILLSAVWMHVPPPQRLRALKTISSLLTINGYLGVTLRLGPADAKRMMSPVDTNELLMQGKKLGLQPVYSEDISVDSMNRKNVFWEKIVFKKIFSDEI